ncbi:hypothetical protein ARMGADRAFT_1032071 [Armillaria gallica]|uniref:Uncharacterized protein n=1 Tax=Armillaria gallica TaxID=47427 RepID=A0A2H3DA41_ARMGA|nr:hypothetical protein ARMGADRAFT_1032071 [Armillaria gallica]
MSVLDHMGPILVPENGQGSDRQATYGSDGHHCHRYFMAKFSMAVKPYTVYGTLRDGLEGDKRNYRESGAVSELILRKDCTWTKTTHNVPPVYGPSPSPWIRAECHSPCDRGHAKATCGTTFHMENTARVSQAVELSEGATYNSRNAIRWPVL